MKNQITDYFFSLRHAFLLGTLFFLAILTSCSVHPVISNLAENDNPTATPILSPSLNFQELQIATPSPATLGPGMIPPVVSGENSSRPTKKIDETINLEASSDPDKSISIHPMSIPELALDDSYLYWLTTTEIYRTPLNKFSKELVTKTMYSKGDLTRMEPVRTGDWLIFLDAQDPDNNNFSVWSLRAFNVNTGAEVSIDGSLNDTSLLSAFSFGADNNLIAWTVVQHSSIHDCEEDTLTVFDLQSRVKHILEQSCVENNYLLTMPRVSGNHMVVEQDLPDAKGGGNNLLLYNLDTDERETLSDDGQSSMPQIDYPWIIWKGDKRFEPATSIGVFNMLTGQSWYVPIDATDGSATDPRLSGHEVFWTEMRPTTSPNDFEPNYNTVYVYDLNTNKLATIDPPGKGDQWVRVVEIHNNSLAWLIDLDHEIAVKDGAIEWETFQLP